MFQRPHYQNIISRIKEKKKFIQVIMGPRQVGKTTLVQQILADYKFPYHYVSADAIGSINTTWIEQQWENARIKFKSSGAYEALLVIDEIQKINNWSEVIKAEWDQDHINNINLKVILLGSSRLLMQQGLTESLAGRFETIYMGHWSLNEMTNAFGFTPQQYIWYGGYPGAAYLINDEKRWKNYVKDALIELSISKDILLLTRIDKPALLKQLFEVGTLYSGQILSYSKLVGQLQDAGNTTTLAHYLSLLDTAGLLAGVGKYYIEKVRQRASSPKFQVYNNALISALLPAGFNETLSNPEQWGRMVESAIGSHLINYSRSVDINVYYWRHRNDEVDFVLEYAGKVIGLEIKSGRTGKLAGMQAFQKKFKPYKMLLIGDRGLTWQEFLKLNPLDLY